MAAAAQNVGKIVEIKGVVLDAVFTERLPEIYTALAIPMGDGNGGGPQRTLIAEVQQHLGDNRVRAVAMDATPGSATKPGTTGGDQQGQQPGAGNGAGKAVGGYRFMRVVKVKKAGKGKKATVRLQILDASGKVIGSRKYKIAKGKRVRLRAAIGGAVGRYGYRIRVGKRTVRQGRLSIKTASKIRVNGATAEKLKVGKLRR